MEEQKLSMEDGRQALADHARERGAEIHALYGPDMDMSVLMQVIGDTRCVRFPVWLEYGQSRLGEGMFGIAEREGEGYVIQIHEAFSTRPDDAVLLLAYHLVTVNYGDFATGEDAEVFAAAILGMDQEAYYAAICRLADELAA